MEFADRTDGGRRLVEALASHDVRDPVVLALPRGGVPVADPVAEALEVPLEVIVVRKIGAPSQPELAIGAIAENDVRVLDATMVERLRLDEAAIAAVEADERRELARRVRHYRGDRPLPELTGRTVVVIDDGLATGATAVAACRAVRAGDPGRVILAVPVGSSAAVETLAQEADEVVCPVVPPMFQAVGQWYASFGQTSDEEVMELLAAHRVENSDSDTPR